MQEVIARGAKVLLITNKSKDELNNNVTTIVWYKGKINLVMNPTNNIEIRELNKDGTLKEPISSDPKTMPAKPSPLLSNVSFTREAPGPSSFADNNSR